MKAPEKIYLDSYGSGFSHGFHTNKLNDNDIEYIRADALIEKACKFFAPYIPDNSGGYERSGVIEDFKNYIKGE